MEWTAFMFRAAFWADNVPIKCATAKQTSFLPFEIFFPTVPRGAANDFGSVCHDSVDNGAGPFLDYEMIAVKESDNGIRCFFNADDMVRVKKHLLFIHAGEKNHRTPYENGYLSINIKKYVRSRTIKHLCR